MKALKWLDENFEVFIMGVAVIVMTIIIVADVFMRNILGNGIAWAQELARQCTIIIGAMGMSYGVSKSKHIKVDILETFVPKLKTPLTICGDLFTFVFCVFILWNGIEKLTKVYAQGTTTPVMQLPTFYIYLMMWIGLTLGAVRVIENYIRKFMGRDAEAQSGEEEQA